MVAVFRCCTTLLERGSELIVRGTCFTVRPRMGRNCSRPSTPPAHRRGLGALPHVWAPRPAFRAGADPLRGETSLPLHAGAREPPPRGQAPEPHPGSIRPAWCGTGVSQVTADGC